MEIMNYRRLILNEYRNAKMNALNNPFNAKTQTYFLKVAAVYRKSRPQRFGCDSQTMRGFYSELQQVWEKAYDH